MNNHSKSSMYKWRRNSTVFKSVQHSDDHSNSTGTNELDEVISRTRITQVLPIYFKFLFISENFHELRISSTLIKDSFHMVHPRIVSATSKPKETEFFRYSATKDISNFKVHAATNVSLTLLTSCRNNLNQKLQFVVSKSELRDSDKFFCFLKQPFFFC